MEDSVLGDKEVGAERACMGVCSDSVADKLPDLMMSAITLSLIVAKKYPNESKKGGAYTAKDDQPLDSPCLLLGQPPYMGDEHQTPYYSGEDVESPIGGVAVERERDFMGTRKRVEGAVIGHIGMRCLYMFTGVRGRRVG